MRSKKQSTRKNREAQVLARTMMAPYLRHGLVVTAIADKSIVYLGDPQFTDFGRAIEASFALKAKAKQTSAGNLQIASEMLTAQALTLDSIFTEMARRAAANMSEHPEACERYLRLALKSQAASRAALEALVRLHQRREQTVRHVNVSEGGQAVLVDHFHQGGAENGTVKQSHAIGAPACAVALSRADAVGKRMPITRRQRKAPMPHARRHESGGAKGEP